MNENVIEITEASNGDNVVDYNGGGYKPAVKFGAWRVAYLKHNEAFDQIKKLERHMETDEIFMLLEGSATLIIGEEQTKIEMLPHKVYNVRMGTWHNIEVTPDAKVFIVENDDTTVNNTEYVYFDKPIA